MRILIVEDDNKTASFVMKGLKELGYAVDRAHDGREGFVMIAANDYDLVIADVMMPEIDGVSMVRSVRQIKANLPIIILSARHSLDSKVDGFEAGADDYLTKPFSFRELSARIQALLRRSHFSEETTLLKFADMELDLISRVVRRGHCVIELQQKEFALLEYMMRSPNRVITRTMILEHVWDINFDPTTNVVDVLVCRLREKIDKNFERKLLHTVRGAGYALK